MMVKSSRDPEGSGELAERQSCTGLCIRRDICQHLWKGIVAGEIVAAMWRQQHRSRFWENVGRKPVNHCSNHLFNSPSIFNET